MILKLTGKVTNAYASPKSGNLYLTIADADTLTPIKLVSEKVGIDEVRPHLDELRVIEMQVKASTFVSKESGERQSLEVLAIRFAPVSAAEKQSVNGAKVPA
jgi:hypothetical protein